MIEAKLAPAKEAFARHLALKAARIAVAAGERRLRAQRRDPARWRLPRLLWPLFTKDR